MADPLVEITRREEFSAAHRLHNPAFSDEENRRLYGPCNNLHGHGHNYAFEVSVLGPVPRETGMVLDLNRLMVLLRERIVAEVDHKHLNHDVSWLQDLVPTAESLAIAFWERLAPEIARYPGCQLVRVRVFESASNLVEYRGPGGTGAGR